MEMPRTIRTRRLVLRPFRWSDVDDVLAYAQHPEWARYLPVPQPYERRDAEDFIARRVLATEDWQGSPVWALELNGSVVGGINIRIDPDRRRAEIGYSVAVRLWGQGLATEAAKAVLDAAFRELGLEKLAARADARNVASIRVMEKLGMKKEGLLRRDRILHGEFIDDVVYGILREEWSSAA